MVPVLSEHRRNTLFFTAYSIYASYTANPNICTVHLINDGVTVNGNTATVEFASSGPTTTFQCSLDGQGFTACELAQVFIHVLAMFIPYAIDAFCEHIVHQCSACSVNLPYHFPVSSECYVWRAFEIHHKFSVVSGLNNAISRAALTHLRAFILHRVAYQELWNKYDIISNFWGGWLSTNHKHE